jgi:hypothetical protein
VQLPALVEAPLDASTLARAVLAQPAAPLTDVADFLGAPAVELEASAISARVAVAAANEGRCFVHHEHRLAPLLGEDTQPELDVGMGDDMVPEDWRDGVLHVPKYFSAFLEAPLPVFNPSHRTKWRPHELMHKLARFAWRPDITRFEAYLTARLSELLPVVHWYGFDEIGRYTRAGRRGIRPDRSLCERTERELVPYWDAESTKAAAEFAATHALEHLSTELEACERELATGIVHPTPRPGLDASSDAVGYLRAHWNRITAWSFGAWVERFTTIGADRFETCADHLTHVRALAHDLLTQPYTLASEAERIAARDRNTASDLGYRLLLHIEALDSDAAEDSLMPSVDALAEGQSVAALLPALTEQLRALDNTTADRPLAGGWGWLPTTEGALRSLEAGLSTALPRALDTEDIPAIAEALGTADRSPTRRPLARRAADLLAARGHARADEATLEAFLRDPPGADLDAERFGGLPDGPQSPGRVRLNTTVRRMHTRRAALDSVLGDASDGPDTLEVVAIRWNGEPRLLEVTPEVAEALERAAAGALPTGEEAEQLLERGFIVWLPAAR